MHNGFKSKYFNIKDGKISKPTNDIPEPAQINIFVKYINYQQ